jgi:hypothetical protein
MVLASLVALVVGSTTLAYPAAAAVACPACYGFERVSENTFVDKAMTPEQRSRTEETIRQARDRVRGFYANLTRNPRVLVCASDECYRRIGGGGSRGMALLDLALFLSPRGVDPVIAAHELSHIELHSRLGWIGTLRRDVPQWFDEGVAVVVSDDPRYLAEAGHGDRCLVSPEADLPVDRSAWIHGASNDQLYAKAACLVSRWISAKGGPGAVIGLVDKVAHGASFDAAYR